MMTTQTDNRVKKINKQMGYMTMQFIVAMASSMLLAERATHYLPMKQWMKVNNNHFLNVAPDQRAQAIADQQEANEEARIETYPAIPGAGANAEAWKRYDAQKEKANIEIKIQAKTMEAIKDTMTSEQITVMNEQHFNTIHEMIEYLERTFSPVPTNIATDEYLKLEDKIKLPNNEHEKEQLIAHIDAVYVLFFQSCMNEANDTTKDVIIGVTRARALEKTAHECEELRIALSNLPANYTHQMLGDIIKNIIRNFKCDAESKANAAAKKKANTKKAGGGQSKKDSKKDEPEKHCKHHPKSTTHNTEDCYQEKKDKKDKAKMLKAAAAAAKKDSSDSDTE